MLTGHKLVGPQPLVLQEVTNNKLATLEVENIGSENAHSDLEWFRVTAKQTAINDRVYVSLFLGTARGQSRI